jgi:hypothetical protein
MVETLLHVDASPLGKRLMRQVVQRRERLQLVEMDTPHAAHEWLSMHAADWLVVDALESLQGSPELHALLGLAQRRGMSMVLVVPAGVTLRGVPPEALVMQRPMDVVRLMQWLEAPRQGSGH